MTTKKKTPQKKVVSKAKPVKKKSNNSLSKKDTQLLNDSLDIIQKLNSEIDSVQKAKSKLEKDVSNLNTKINSKPKQEVKKETTKVSNNLTELLEIEIEKVRSEIKSKSNSTKRELNNKFQEIETKVLDAIRTNDKIQKELSNSPNSDELMKEIEKKLNSQINSSANKTKNLITITEKEIENLKLQISKLQKSVTDAKADKSVDFSAIESKLNNLQKQNTSLKKLVEKYEDNLYERKQSEIKELDEKIKQSMSKEREKNKELLSNSHKELLETKKELERKLSIIEKENQKFKDTIESYKKEIISIEKVDVKSIEDKVNSNVKEASQTLSEIQNAKRGQTEFLVNKVNEIIDNVNSFEEELKTLDVKSLKEIKKQTEAHFKDLKKEFLESINKEVSGLREIQAKDLDKIFQKIKEKETNTDNSLIKFRDETLNSIKNQSKEFDKGLINVKEDIAKELLKVNDFKTQALTELKEEKRNLREDIENKLVKSNSQYEATFNENIKRFEEELKLKESNFLNKLLVVDDEKNHMIKELSDFKADIAKLTKDYISKLDEEFQKIKIEETNFTKQKEDFTNELSQVTQVRKLELEDFAVEMKSSISKVLEDEKQTFNRHEETFREVFNERIQNLTEFSKKRLEQIEKKFVDKNLKYVQNRIDEGMSELKILESSIYAKADETLKRVETLEEKEESFIANIDAELEKMHEKLEQRITSEEKSLNKRFLDVENDFGNFKSIVIDEVEDLIREVNSVVSQKLELVDRSITKMNFESSNLNKKTQEYTELHNLISEDIKEVRDEVSDIRVKVDVGAPQLESMNSLIQMMSEYESGLVTLIKSLKDRGIKTEDIKSALMNKGHPLFYVEMVMDHIHKIKN